MLFMSFICMILYMWIFVMIFFCRTLFFFCFFVFTLLLSTCTFSYPLTCIVERSDFLYITKFYRKYFEDSQDLLKLLLTRTQTTIDFSYQANESFPLLEALTQGYHIHNQSWSQRCQVNVVRVLWSITELLLFAIEITGKICLLHFCLAYVKEEKLKQVGGKSCFLSKLNTTCRKSVEVQWMFYTCGGGCTFSVIIFWCYVITTHPVYHQRHYLTACVCIHVELKFRPETWPSAKIFSPYCQQLRNRAFFFALSHPWHFCLSQALLLWQAAPKLELTTCQFSD